MMKSSVNSSCFLLEYSSLEKKNYKIGSKRHIEYPLRKKEKKTVIILTQVHHAVAG